EVGHARVVRRIVAARNDVGDGVVAGRQHADAGDHAVAVAVHDAVAAEHVHDARDRVEPDVLRQDLGRVLGAHEPGLEHREAGGHPHHERAAYEEVERVERVRQFQYAFHLPKTSAGG